MLPEFIGVYKIESLLNKGRTHALYLGIDPENHQPLAIKVLEKQYITHPEMVERFMHEAQVIEVTNHPNIVQLYAHGKWERGLYIAMEFIQGISLRQMILQESFSLRRTVQIILQIAYALTHLHAHGIIHRDLKPENILLTAQGGIKVIDFGISQVHEGPARAQARFEGSPLYMSPEQREDPLNVHFSSDIYSLGVVAYELLLGKLSYGSIQLSLLPQGLQKMLANALQPRVEDRYLDIVDFIHDLNRYLASNAWKRDMRGSDYLGELGLRVREAQSLLLPGTLVQHAKLDLGFTSNCQSSLSSLYCAVFPTVGERYTIVLAESMNEGMQGLLNSALLKGMVYAHSDLLTSPKELVSLLNQKLYDLGTRFSFSLLSLLLDTCSFSYIGCGYTPVWYRALHGKGVQRFSAQNPLLGSNREIALSEVEFNFNQGDLLLLHSFQIGQTQSTEFVEKREADFVHALEEARFLAAQKCVEAIFRKIAKPEQGGFFDLPATLFCANKVA